MTSDWDAFNSHKVQQTKLFSYIYRTFLHYVPWMMGEFQDVHMIQKGLTTDALKLHYHLKQNLETLCI
jgi:hypothetical protein